MIQTLRNLEATTWFRSQMPSSALLAGAISAWRWEASIEDKVFQAGWYPAKWNVRNHLLVTENRRPSFWEFRNWGHQCATTDRSTKSSLRLWRWSSRKQEPRSRPKRWRVPSFDPISRQNGDHRRPIPKVAACRWFTYHFHGDVPSQTVKIPYVTFIFMERGDFCVIFLWWFKWN